MKRFILFLSCLIVFSSASKGASTFPMTLAWNDSANTAISLSAYVNRDINAEGYVTATGAGHFAVNSGRIKFWGTNTTFGGNFPSTVNAAQVAGRLAKYGFNIVRFHHMDMYDIWTTTNPDRVISPSKLALLDYFIYSLKQKGIYADLNLVVSRPFNRGSDLPADIDLITDWKVRDALGFFDPQTRQLQKDYAHDLLTHVNPYTGNAYINEPAVAFIEINNENGLTQAFLSGQLDPLPPYYSNLLNAQWNAWLKTKYSTHAALVTGWNVLTTPAGPEKIVNGNFAAAPGAEWQLQVIATAAAAGAVTAEGAGTGFANDYRINITTAEPANTWHVQFMQANLGVQTGKAYTFSFWAKADAGRVMNVNIMQAGTPWANLGFSSNVSLTTAWQQFTYITPVNADEANARVTFSSLASATGTVWITGVSLKEGGTIGLYPGENLDTNTMKNFLNTGETIGRTAEARKDWFRFLQETETAYWTDMRDYVRNTLGAHALIFGTIIGCSTPNVQSVFDAIDTHTYWQHPSFPGTPWDSIDWYVGNYPMVNNQQGSTVANIGVKAVLNKPLLVTEYNHPHPNSYESEAMFFLSTYGSLQDWDAVFPFDYYGSDSWGVAKIDSYFSVNPNPVKMASMIPAALAFYRGDIAPANSTVVLPIDKNREIDELVTAWAWQLVDGAKIGESPKSALIHKVRIAVEGQAVPGGSIAPGATNSTGNVMTSDTGQVVWDMSNTSAGFVKVDTAMTKMVYGFQNGRTYYLSGVTITPGASLAGGFSSIAVSAFDGDSFASAQKILVTALGVQQNTGASFYIYPNTPTTFPPAMNAGITLRNQWGNSPVLTEGIPAVITLPCIYANTQVWALDSTGARASAVPVVNSGGFASFSIDPSYSALWYEVAVSHPEYTPTATATNTPVYSPTMTPTITLTSTPVTGIMVDDCELIGSGQNLWSGWWYTYNDTTTTVTGGKQAPGGPVTTAGKYVAAGNMYASGYAGIGTNLSNTGGDVNLTAYEGLQMYIKGDGTAVHIAIITGNFVDAGNYSNWEFLVPTTAVWTLVKIPFSSMTQPGGPALAFDLTRGRDIQWKIGDSGAFTVEIDDVMFYYPAATATITPTRTRTVTSTFTRTFTRTLTPTRTPTLTLSPTLTFTISGTHTVSPTATESMTGTPPTSTPTPTITETHTDSPTDTVTETGTVTPTVTVTVSETITETETKSETVTLTETETPVPSVTVTFTRTLTRTITLTRTRTPVLTATPTPTATATNNPATVPAGIEGILVFPQPFNPVSGDLTIRFNSPGSIKSAEVKIFTAGLRLIRHFPEGAKGPGQVNIIVPGSGLSRLSNGTYYYFVKVTGDNGAEISSRLQVLVIIK